MTTIGILFFDDAEELDAIGPWEVFTMARHFDSDIQVVSISQNGGTVRCAKGLRVEMDHGFADAPKLDVLLVPGGQGTRREVENAELLAWIDSVAVDCQWVTSVCTGSLLLAAAGPAQGKRVTTHWQFVDTLRRKGLASEVLDDVRFVRDGQVVTSAGVSAGIDMALWIVGQLHSPERARDVQRAMEYDPAPPYAAAV